MAMTVIRLAAIRPPSASSSAASPSLWPPARLRLRVRCRAGGDGGMKKEEGEAEAPESLFARELRRRGMAPGAAAPTGASKEAEEGAPEAGAKRGVAATEFERGAAADGQRERSMALNSEGLEVRLPRPPLSLSLSRARARHGQSWPFLRWKFSIFYSTARKCPWTKLNEARMGYGVVLVIELKN